MESFWIDVATLTKVPLHDDVLSVLQQQASKIPKMLANLDLRTLIWRLESFPNPDQIASYPHVSSPGFLRREYCWSRAETAAQLRQIYVLAMRDMWDICHSMDHIPVKYHDTVCDVWKEYRALYRLSPKGRYATIVRDDTRMLDLRYWWRTVHSIWARDARSFARAVATETYQYWAPERDLRDGRYPPVYQLLKRLETLE